MADNQEDKEDQKKIVEYNSDGYFTNIMDVDNQQTEQGANDVILEKILDQAVISVVPEIRNIDLIKKQTNNKEMSIDEIKSFMFQLEAEKKQEPKEQSTVKRAAFTGTKSTKEGRCHRCNKPGHWANECTLKEKGLWLLLPTGYGPQRR